jgi:hypothetical protein
MVDMVALESFLMGTALLYIDEIAGAVIAVSILLTFLLYFRDKYLERLYR